MPEPADEPQFISLPNRIRGEAAISTRPGQFDRLTAIADEVANWERVADDLMRALESFMAYDGYGEGGAADGNRGDWRSAGQAEDAYRKAKGNG
jgi:hypothetical protein